MKHLAKWPPPNPMSTRNLRTGEVATQAGVSIATLRYYERRGLIPAPSRTASGYRAFDAETIRLVRLIKRAQGLGFTLKEVHRLLAVVMAADGTCSELNELAHSKLADLDAQLESLREKRSALADMLTDCVNDPGATTGDCRFLHKLESAEGGDTGTHEE